MAYTSQCWYKPFLYIYAHKVTDPAHAIFIIPP